MLSIFKLKYLSIVALTLTFLVVGMGAYTRLTEAGLGCPDWPGCYGHHSVPNSPDEIAKAVAAFPDTPFEPHKAWNEMIHRYLAGGLGLLILAFALRAWLRRTDRWLCMGLLVAVIFQAALGMWTVTMNLMPLVVTGHLLGGFFVLALLFIFMVKQWPMPKVHITYGSGLAWLAWSALVVLLLQIVLGGWTSSNYAAVVCTQLPLCEGSWWQNYNLMAAIDVPKADTYQYGVLDYGARTTIHVTHRIWAGVTAFCLVSLALLWLVRSQDRLSRSLAWLLLLAVSVQFALGVSNVVLQLPIAVAVAHNLVAACLVLLLVSLLLRLAQAKGMQGG